MLYIVPTPIGNLEDMTFRAVRILKEVQAILCEDTRTTRNLLTHYDIKNTVLPFHQHNEHHNTTRFVEQMKAGADLAIVSDAGTPGISDAAYLLVRACVADGVRVECLPGATALIPAVVASGIPCDSFLFEGFLPQKKGRQTRITELLKQECTVVMYESPHRLLKLLEQLKALGGANRQCSVAREISKKFEEHVRGSVSEVCEHFTKNAPRGECVVTLAAYDKNTTAPSDDATDI